MDQVSKYSVPVKLCGNTVGFNLRCDRWYSRIPISLWKALKTILLPLPPEDDPEAAGEDFKGCLGFCSADLSVQNMILSNHSLLVCREQNPTVGLITLTNLKLVFDFGSGACSVSTGLPAVTQEDIVDTTDKEEQKNEDGVYHEESLLPHENPTETSRKFLDNDVRNFLIACEDAELKRTPSPRFSSGSSDNSTGCRTPENCEYEKPLDDDNSQDNKSFFQNDDNKNNLNKSHNESDVHSLISEQSCDQNEEECSEIINIRKELSKSMPSKLDISCENHVESPTTLMSESKKCKSSDGHPQNTDSEATKKMKLFCCLCQGNGHVEEDCSDSKGGVFDGLIESKELNVYCYTCHKWGHSDELCHSKRALLFQKLVPE